VPGKNRSWIALIVFCTATTVITALALAIVFASATVVYSMAQSAERPGPSGISAPAQTFSGVITDAHCGAKHKLADKSPAECARICVKNGSKYVLVNGDKMYALHGGIVELNRVAGERVTITGSLAGNRINITSISDGQ
jgi:hypothetical protein